MSAEFTITLVNGKPNHAVEHFPVRRKRAKGGKIDSGPLGEEIARIALTDEQARFDLNVLIQLHAEGALGRAQKQEGKS